jgi:hypothetical protein
LEGGVGPLRQVSDQDVQLRVRLALEATTISVGVLVGVETAGYVLPAKDFGDCVAVNVCRAQVPVGRRSPRIVVRSLGHLAPLYVPILNHLTT